MGCHKSRFQLGWLRSSYCLSLGRVSGLGARTRKQPECGQRGSAWAVSGLRGGRDSQAVEAGSCGRARSSRGRRGQVVRSLARRAMDEVLCPQRPGSLGIKSQPNSRTWARPVGIEEKAGRPRAAFWQPTYQCKACKGLPRCLTPTQRVKKKKR